MTVVIVTMAHRASYPDPVRAGPGERVTLGKVDADNPAWRWCTGPDGREGWIHSAFYRLESDAGIITQDYDARELTVAPGEQLEVIDRAGGWVWCRAADGRLGWVPEGNVAAR